MMYDDDSFQRHRPPLSKRWIIIVLALVFILCLWHESQPSHSTAFVETLLQTKQYSPRWVNTTAATSQNDRDESFVPLQVLRTYQAQHSHLALVKEQLQLDKDNNDYSTRRRQFSIAYYWCPHRAGNILHSFFNTIVWSMIHNRTVLWKYHNTSNQESDCQAILHRASWLPSYDYWKNKLELSVVEPIPVSLTEPWTKDDSTSQHVVLYPQISDVLIERTDITRHAWSDHPLKRKDYQEYIQTLPDAFQNTTMALYEQGYDFLYGMLYDELFQLQVPTTPKEEVVSPKNSHHSRNNNTAGFSLALHSRHTVAADDGSFIVDEVKCLETLLFPHHHNADSITRQTEDSCQVYLMSDRQTTIDLLTEWLTQHNCSAITARHEDRLHVVGTTADDDPIQEHGPWAGAGFLQDLDVISNARHGIIGDLHRSSTALLMHLLEYRRKMAVLLEENNAEDVVSNGNLVTCKLPQRSPSGYDYGPGSPTFRHHSFLQPLAPVKVLDVYLENHSVDTTSTTSTTVITREQYVLVSFDYLHSTPKSVYLVLNSKC